MIGKRLAALAGALVLVLGAVLVRRALDGERLVPGEAAPVVCEPALVISCNSAYGADRVRSEAPGLTADRLLAGEVEPFIWVASPLWFDVVSGEAQRRASADPIDDVSTAAHTELMFLATGDAADTCGGVVSWSCLADPDLGLDLGLDPRSTSVGLESYGRLVAAHLGTSEFATNDFDRAFSTWQRRLDASIDEATVASPAYAVHLARRGTYDAVTAASADLARLDRELTGLTGSGSVIEVGEAIVGGADGGDSEALRAALVADGWTSGPGEDAGRPSAGVLQALR